MSIDKKIFYNSAWMMLEKFLGIFGLIFVNSYMAKYIGPESFGKLAFAMSIFVFVQTFSWFGADPGNDPKETTILNMWSGRRFCFWW